MYNPDTILFAGIALAFFSLLRMIYRCILFFLLIYVVRKLIKKSYRKAIVSGVILFVLAVPDLFLICSQYVAERKASVEFLGDYKLENLDGEECIDCKVRLLKNYRYDIYVGDEIVGHGKWEVRSAYDIPDWFFTLDGDNVVRRKNQTIDFITR